MTERVAIVGSRQGADLSDVEHFVRALWVKHPDTILVSGGEPNGVDWKAEQTWLELGGQVESFRPTKLRSDPEEWGVEKWVLGTDRPTVYLLSSDPTWGNFVSAALYRDMLIAEAADRTVAFMRKGGSRGAGFTAEMTENAGKPAYRYEAA